jgi:hypothetical protein
METHNVKLCEDSPLGRKGQMVALSLSPDDVHTAEEMSSYLAGYHPLGFRADEASKPILVDHDTDQYRTFSSNDAFRQVNVKASREQPPPEVDPVSSLATYNVVDRFLGSFVNDITDQNATKLFRPMQQAMKRVKWALQLDREVDVWTLLSTLANWATANRTTLAAGFQWNGGASADPILDVQTRIEASIQPVTGIYFNQRVAFAFLRHPSVRDHMRQMLGDNAAEGAVRGVADAGSRNVDFVIPGLPPFHVVAGKVLNETTSAHDYILPDDVVLCSAPPGIPTDGEEIATSYTFRRRGDQGVGFDTRQFRVENRGPKGGTMVVTSMADIAVMTANNVGGLIKDAYQ